MKQTEQQKTAIKKHNGKAFVSEAWLKEDNIGKAGFILSHKNFKVKFSD